jgi:enoyl-CoA hydratase/carnithine racemase
VPGTVLYEAGDGVAALTLERCERLTAMTAEPIEEPAEAVGRAHAHGQDRAA